MEKMSTRALVTAAMIAALYTALCIALAPLSFGMVQVRIAEALTLLPVFSPVAIWGVTIGCALSNLVGFMTGANILGFLDIVFGTAATLVAAILSYQMRNIRFCGLPVLSALPPVLINAAVIGAELTYMGAGTLVPGIFFINAAYVGIGQTISCVCMGLPLVFVLEKTGAARVMA